MVLFPPKDAYEPGLAHELSAAFDWMSPRRSVAAVVMITPAIGAAVLVGYLETQGAPRRTMMIAL
ncbi:MAG: hypothetical protein AAF732_04680, partial [Pseudomonadota bacterium]